MSFVVLGIFGLLILLWLACLSLERAVAKKDMWAYYKSKEWAKKRREAFAFHGKACLAGNTDMNLQVHHLRYRKWFTPIFGRENVKKDLVILCKLHHPRGKYTRFEIKLRQIYFKVFRS